MDFLETSFGFAPDGGSGVAELCVVMFIAIALSAWLLSRSRWRRGRAAQQSGLSLHF